MFQPHYKNQRLRCKNTQTFPHIAAQKTPDENKGHVLLKDVLRSQTSGSGESQIHILLNQFCTDARKSETFQMLADDIADLEWGMEFEEIGNKGHCLDFGRKIITLDSCGLQPSSILESKYFCNLVFLCFLRATRDIWQEMRWPDLTRHLCPDSIMLIERLKSADVDVVSALMAWEMKEAGDDSLWRHIISSDDADITKPFSAPAAQKHSSAALSFHRWFESSDRVRWVDHETLEYMDTLLFSNERNPFGKNRLTPRDVARVGCFPDKKSYLSETGRAILEDPFYVGMQDPVNQAHFYHIVKDIQCITVQGVQFQDRRLARMIFPEEKVMQD